MKHLLAACLMTLAGAAGAQTAADLSPDVWVHTVTTDKMTGKTGATRSIWSVTKVELAPPYQGAQPLILNVGRTPGGETFALVSVVKGQFACRGCDVRVRFDDEQPEVFTGLSTIEQSGMLHLKGADRFIKRLQASKAVLVEVPIWRAGLVPVEFKTAGLGWE